MARNGVRNHYRPVIYALLTALVLLSLTQFAAQQRKAAIEESELDALRNELYDTRIKFQDLLMQNVSSANTLAIIYKRYRGFRDFDSIASQVVKYNQFIDYIAVSEKFRVSHVYPQEGNESILGINLLDYPLFRDERELSIKNSTTVFLGPYHLVNGRELGIGCRLPIVVNDSFVGSVNVVTEMPTIFERLPGLQNKSEKFVYQFTKENPLSRKVESFLPDFTPRDEHAISFFIPEGNWRLHVAYSSKYPKSRDAMMISVVGALLSVIVVFFVYRNAQIPVRLAEQVRLQTRDLDERVKELTTIYKLNELLKGEHLDKIAAIKKIVQLLPSGWAYPEFIAARIHFDGEDFCSDNYSPSPLARVSNFELFDGRKGFVEIVCLQQLPHTDEIASFSKEERNFIDAVADTISVHFNRAAHLRSLMESEARFRGAFEDTTVGMSILSLDGKLLRINRAAQDILDYTEAELRYRDPDKITHPDDLPKEQSLRQEMLDGKRNAYHIEKRYIKKDGSIIWVNRNLSLVRDETGRALYFVSQIENITERMESEHKFQHLVENSLVGVYIIQDDRFVYVNPVMMRESGYNEEEFKRLTTDQFIYKEDIPIVRKNISERLHAKSHNIHYEIRVLKKSGEMIWVELFGSATHFNGKPAIIGTMVNNTARKQLELEREQMLQVLLQRNKELQDFNFALSHVVRAPLATILGLVAALKTVTSPTEKAFILDGLEDTATQLDEAIRSVNKVLQAAEDKHLGSQG